MKRRKPRYDPRLLSFTFEVMADHIEQIQAENAEDDKLVEAVPDNSVPAAPLPQSDPEPQSPVLSANDDPIILLGAYIIEHFPRCGRLKRLQTLFSMNLHVQQ
jgi:hypothetical protein